MTKALHRLVKPELAEFDQGQNLMGVRDPCAQVRHKVVNRGQ